MFSEYIKSVITVSLCAFICSFTCDGLCNGKGTSRGLRLITSLCVFSVILLPLISAFKDADAEGTLFPKKTYEADSSISLDTLTEKELSGSVSREIFEKTGINTVSADINISCEGDKLSIDSATVYVNTKEEKQEVTSVLRDMLGEETEIRVVEIEGNKEAD